MSSDNGSGEDTVCAAAKDDVSGESTMGSREQLILAQEDDVELHPLINDVVGEEEGNKYANCFTGSQES